MDYEDAFFDTKHFNLTKQKLGEGAFGRVFVVERVNDKTKFAAKMIDPKGMLNGIDQLRFLRESQILNKLKHPAIVKFYGINFHSFEDNSKLEPTILTEFVINGSLKSVLEKERQNKCDKRWNATAKYICLLGIVDAMRYLHANRIIHRDLKSLNVLMDEDFHPRVCDFGISRCFSQELSNSIQISMTGGIGSPLYMAPELLEGEDIYGSSIDVYAFAILAFEIVTGLIPYSHLKKVPSQYQLATKVKNGERPHFNDKVSKKMKDLIELCWSRNPYERPSFGEIFQALSTDFSYSKEPINDQQVKDYLKSLSDANQVDISKSLVTKRLSGLLFDVSKLNIVEEIRKGAIGTFHKAILPATDEHPQATYVLKVINSISSLKAHREYLTSIELQSSLKHPGIIRIIGFAPPTEENNHYYIVLELASNGSLEDMINRINKGNKPPNWETLRAIIIFGIAAAMAYIHQHDIVLADLRPMSVLFDENNRPRIGGFANSFFLKQGTQSHDESWKKGIALYMAPELYSEDHLPFSNKIDVYAYAILLHEIFCLKKPLTSSVKLLEEVSKGKRPELNNPNIPKAFQDLIKSCWNQNPDERPSFMQIVQKFLKERDEFFDMSEINEDEFDEYIDEVIKDLSFW